MVGVTSPIPGVVYLPQDALDRYRHQGAITDETLIGQYNRTFADRGDAIALSTPGATTTFAELDRLTDGIAAGLSRMGLHAGDRAMFQMRNCPELVHAFLACLKIGIIPVCTLAAHREQEIGYIGNHTAAKVYFIHGDDPRFDTIAFARKMTAQIPSIAHVVVARGGTEPGDGLVALGSLADGGDAAANAALVGSVVLDPRQVVVFQLSGGTSGIPKIIPRFNNEYLGAMRSVVSFMGLGTDTIAFTPNPFMHNAPMSCIWGPTLLVGGEIVIAEGPSLAQIEAALAARRPNWIAIAKVHLLRLAESGAFDRVSLSHARAIAVPDSALSLGAQIGGRCITMYGMTEGLLAFSHPDDSDETRGQTVGRSTSPHDEIRIVIPGTEEDIPDGEIGELLVRGPSTIRGYFDAPDRDVEAFTADGFYRSGDLMTWRTIDGVRNLVFNGRVKDVIDRGGEKINCGEVEVAIDSHPDVGAVACVAMPDPMYGERMCAFIVPKDGAPPIELKSLTDHLAAHGLAKFKWPERIELVADLPATTSGKVSKPLMREIVAAKLAAERAA